MKLNSIAFKLPTAVAALCIVVAGALAYYAYSASYRILLEEAETRLDANMDASAEGLQHLIMGFQSELILQSENPAVRDAIADFSAAWNLLPETQPEYLKDQYITKNPHPAGEKGMLRSASNGSQYSRVHAKYHPFFSQLGAVDVQDSQIT